VCAVIGSGWFFSSFDAAQIGGGGGAVTAWILGVSLVLVLAFVHAELGTMFPVDGGTARFPLYAFGRVTGFFSGWFAWISAVCVPAREGGRSSWIALDAASSADPIAMLSRNAGSPRRRA